ncbi:MAG: bifunctional folylpolyglutamate synthase/dihydrofolate synthase [Parvularculaceae bacterium]|nr:bifunctional folylpolyglutamate synthase/dihydrofolate synthase [Parvularculaceae bacterium]
MTRVLARLDDPHLKLPDTFHVAGTNGKGSTAAYLRHILEANGARVDVFSSPHLIRYNERIILAGREIEDAQFLDAIRRIDRAAGEADLTFFEMLTGAAFLVFSESSANFLILEVGLGGRLDATNVIGRSVAAIITPVALDHQNFLGDNVVDIAKEKAGIFRRNVPAVIGPQTADVMAALRHEAVAAGARPFGFGAEWSTWSEHGRLIFQDLAGLSDLAPPKMVGAHQLQNAALAVAAIRAADVKASDDVISIGLQTATWPARMQRLKSGPLVEKISCRTGAEIWLDGGHNPHAARALTQVAADMEERDPKPLILIVGMQQNKDAEAFFREFAGLAALACTVQAAHPGAYSAADLSSIAVNAGMASRPFRTIEQAINFVLDTRDAAVRIIICGSLYLAGEVLRANA